MAITWTLTANGFERLLGALDEDRERAAVEYARLHARITALFGWWGSEDCDALADATMDRVVLTLENGKQIPRRSFQAYVKGVARMIFHEYQRAARQQRAISYLAQLDSRPIDPAAPLLDRLDPELARLSEEDRGLVLRYYGDGRKEDIRRQLACEFGMSVSNLRLRAHRIRQRLEARFSEDAAVSYS